MPDLKAKVVNTGEISASFELRSTAPFNNPFDLKMSVDGKTLYVSDVRNNEATILDPNTLRQLGF